jgi:hypothetical protein
LKELSGRVPPHERIPKRTLSCGDE